MAHDMTKSNVTFLQLPPTPYKKEFYEKYWFKFFTKSLNLVLNLFPPLRRYIAKTASGMLGRAFQCLKAENYDEAYQLCSAGLIKFRHKTDSLGHYDWWEFMRYGTNAAEHLEEIDKKEDLISLAEKGIQPFEGFGVAYSYCLFSRWKYQEKDYDSAITFAERAVKADESYAEAHALVGWYKLFIDQSDPLEHFVTAIKCDNEYLSKLISAPEMANFPNIISELRELKLVK
jgi:hypothetical protein